MNYSGKITGLARPDNSIPAMTKAHFEALHATAPNVPKTGSQSGSLPVGYGQLLTSNGAIINTNTLSSGYNYPSSQSWQAITSGSSKPLVQRSDSPDLPPIMFDALDVAGNKVKMTLKPEFGITSGETVKLMMLTMAYVTEPEKFCPLAYVKKNNLEKHFTYA